MRIYRSFSRQRQILFSIRRLCLLFLLPVIAVLCLHGREGIEIDREVDPEDVLPLLLYQELVPDSDLQVACAQAVLVRSRVCVQENSNPEYRTVCRKNNYIYERNHRLEEERLTLCKRAVRETRGVCLSVGGTVVEGPYCMASNGYTRAGVDVWAGEDKAWLVSVESPWDLDYKEDREPQIFDAEEIYTRIKKEIIRETFGKDAAEELVLSMLPEKTEILDRIIVSEVDARGYVNMVNIGSYRMPGEFFRAACELSSISFTIHKEGERLYIYARGGGHGCGMSLYGAKGMAAEGKNWREILEYYFPQAEIAKITDHEYE